MALDTYQNVQTAIGDWLARTDLAAVIPDFITLAEAEMKRRIRRSTTRTTVTLVGEFTAPPADMAELRSAYLVSDQPEMDNPLRVSTPEMMAERRARSAGVAGRPTDIAYVAGQFMVAPIPDQNYTVEIIYFTQLTALSSATPVNAILQEAPDAYLFGALLQAEPYLENDPRIPTWRAGFDNAIDQLNMVRDREEYNASIKSIRLPMVFG